MSTQEIRMDRIDDPVVRSSLIQCPGKQPATNTKERMSKHSRGASL